MYTKDRWKDFQALFPEQTKTVPRTICWSIILLLNVAAVCLLTIRWNLADFIDYKLLPILIIAAVFFLFWLEGFIFYRIRNLFR